MRKDPVLIILLIAGFILIFANLGNIYLWQDEAETAVVAKNTLTYGIPKGYDGKNILYVTGGLGPNYIWIYHSWLQFYLVALSFLIFGLNTFAARLPFAIFGLLSIFLSYRLSWRLFEDRAVARISTLLLTFCVPFLLHIRQCRYYSLTVFMVLLTMLVYLQFVENKKFSTTKLIACAILLFHSNHGISIPVLSALFLHYIIFHFKTSDFKKLIATPLLVGIFTIPWVISLRSYHHAQENISFYHLRRHFEFYFRTINKYVFPLVFFSVVSTICLAIKRRRPSLPKDLNKSRLFLIALIAVVTIAFLLFVDERHFRYIIHLVPLFFIAQGLILSRWLKINKYLTILVILILLFSNFFNNPKLQFPLFKYFYEITHDYNGPNEGIVKYLQENAEPLDTVKVPYGDRPIIFYTDVFVDSRPFFENETYPEWIIFRKDWLEKRYLEQRYFQIITRRYEKIEIDYPDIMWGNRPEPGYHKFRTVSNWSKVVIYKRKK